MIQTIKVKWTGIRPLILHNGQTADPLNKFSVQFRKLNVEKKAIKKGDEEAVARWHEKYADAEWRASIYYDETDGLIIPSDVIEATIEAGARKSKRGKDAKAAVYCAEENASHAVLDYDGPKSIEKLIKEPRYRLSKPVRVGNARVCRTRAMLPTGWSMTFKVEYDDGVMGRDALLDAMMQAGALVGMCDWRPKFGRFTVEEVE